MSDSDTKQLRTVQAYAVPIWSGTYRPGRRPNNVVAESEQEAYNIASAQLKEGEWIETVTPFGPRYEVADG